MFSSLAFGKNRVEIDHGIAEMNIHWLFIAITAVICMNILIDAMERA